MVCLNCENEFTPKRDTAKFCCDVCRATFNQNIKSGVIAVKIYALINPITNLPFYIGKTVGSLTQRLRAHINDREGNRVKRKIIADLKEKNVLPTIVSLEEMVCKNEDEEIKALMREEYWINFYKLTADLCNVSGLTQEFTPRILSKHIKHRSKSIFSGGLKSIPMSIRYDPEDAEFIFKREGLQTIQQVIDFLLHEYCKIYRVEKKSVFDVKDEPDNNKSERHYPKNGVKTVLQYMNEISELEYEDEFRDKATEIQEDENLTIKQKELLFLNMKQSKN